MYKVGLILEGGGMRGSFTAGVLDFFMEKGLEFKDCYGVSAGSCHGCNYISKQIGRSLEVSTKFLKDKRYCGMFSLLTTGDLFGVKMSYDKIPNELIPFDYDAFLKCKTAFYAVVTNCRTGKAEYKQIKDLRKDMIAIRASSSLPLVSRMVTIGHEKYLDGGLADSIPIKESIKNGNDYNIVVLTRDKNYQKAPNKLMIMHYLRYFKYQKLVKTIKNRHIKYNETLQLIDQEEAKGKAFVIRPQIPLEIKRAERNEEKVKMGYRQGYETAKKIYDSLLEFLEKQKKLNS